MERCSHYKIQKMELSGEAIKIKVTLKKECCNYKEYSYTYLQLEDDAYICESCAQVMGVLANFLPLCNK